MFPSHHPRHTVFQQTWEAKDYLIDGSFCAQDVDTFGVGYSVRPCLEILDYTASSNEAVPDVIFVSKQRAEREACRLGWRVGKIRAGLTSYYYLLLHNLLKQAILNDISRYYVMVLT